MDLRKIESLIQELAIEVFKADRGYHLAHAISDSADRIHREAPTFDELFGTIQDHALWAAVLSVARLFDRPSTNNPTQCFERLLRELETHRDSLPAIIEVHNVEEELRRLGILADGGTLGSLTTSSGEPAAVAILRAFRSRVDNEAVKTTLEHLRQVRDKKLAHNDATEVTARLTWNSLSDLLELAKDLISLVGWAWLPQTVVYAVGGRWLSDTDAKRPSVAFGRLLDQISAPPGSRLG